MRPLCICAVSLVLAWALPVPRPAGHVPVPGSLEDRIYDETAEGFASDPTIAHALDKAFGSDGLGDAAAAPAGRAIPGSPAADDPDDIAADDSPADVDAADSNEIPANAGYEAIDATNPSEALSNDVADAAAEAADDAEAAVDVEAANAADDVEAAEAADDTADAVAEDADPAADAADSAGYAVADVADNAGYVDILESTSNASNVVVGTGSGADSYKQDVLVPTPGAPDDKALAYETADKTPAQETPNRHLSPAKVHAPLPVKMHTPLPASPGKVGDNVYMAVEKTVPEPAPVAPEPSSLQPPPAQPTTHAHKDQTAPHLVPAQHKSPYSPVPPVEADAAPLDPAEAAASSSPPQAVPGQAVEYQLQTGEVPELSSAPEGAAASNPLGDLLNHVADGLGGLLKGLGYLANPSTGSALTDDPSAVAQPGVAL